MPTYCCPRPSGSRPRRWPGPITREPLVAFTFAVNYAGFAAATVPCGLVRGLPAGLQIIGRPGSEGLILRISRAFEAAHPWPECQAALT